MPVVAVLGIVPETVAAATGDFAELKKGAAELGLEEDRNVAFAWYWNTIENYPALAKAVVASRPSVIVTPAGSQAVQAVKNATSSIPFVALLAGDPVKQGLITSWNRPGGNITGVVMPGDAIVAKQVELMSALLPPPAIIGVMIDLSQDAAASEAAAREAAAKLQRTILLAPTASEKDFEPAVQRLQKQGAAGLVVPTAAFFNVYHAKLAVLAAKYRLPAIYADGDLAVSGGLMKYGVSVPGIFHQLGTFAGKILKGANPAEMPVEQPELVTLTINLKTAKALGLDIPLPLLGRADEVVE